MIFLHFCSVFHLTKKLVKMQRKIKFTSFSNIRKIYFLYFDFTKNLPFDVLWSNQDPGWSTESDPRVSRNHFGGKTLTGILDEELGDEVFSLIGDVLPLGLRKVEMTVLDGVKE